MARRRFPPVLFWIGGICIAVELALQLADFGLIGSRLWRGLAYQYGAFWPGLLHGWEPNFALQPVTMFVTYAFLHGGLGHLGGNMLTLLALGTAVSARAGQRGFLIIYALSALGGAALFGLLASGSQPMVGASGALFGLAGAWQYWDFADPGRRAGRVKRLVTAAGGLAVLNLVLWVAMSGLLAWQTHLGGFLAGWAAASMVTRPLR